MSTPQPPIPHVSPFDAIKQIGEAGSEFWSARALAKLLRYSKWDKFELVMERAKEACQRSSNSIEHHFSKRGK